MHAKKIQSIRNFVLDRPAALNALNLDMIYTMTPQLQAWSDSDLCKVIILSATKDAKAFCAGGDVKAIVQQQQRGDGQVLKFFEEEYKLDHLIGTLQKPFVSVLDGVTMGGGAGLSVHGPLRIATERTVFAMPETAIGLFPDVGSSFFLPRLDGFLGTFLGLTGHRLKGQDVFYAGIATHYIPSSRLDSLYARLAELESDDLKVVNKIIDEFSADVPKDAFDGWSLGGAVSAAIDRCFCFDSVEEIVAALRQEGTQWAEDQLKVLSAVSPLSLKVSLALLREGAKRHFSDCFQMEYRLVGKFLANSDFVEGVTAKLINKQKTANWKTKFDQLSSIPDAEVAKYFQSDPNASPLKLLNRYSFYDYPHRTLSGLPTDRDVQRVVDGDARRGMTGDPPSTLLEASEYILRHWGTYDNAMIGEHSIPKKNNLYGGVFGRTKIGLAEKVESILKRRTRQSKDRLEWI